MAKKPPFTVFDLVHWVVGQRSATVPVPLAQDTLGLSHNHLCRLTLDAIRRGLLTVSEDQRAGYEIYAITALTAYRLGLRLAKNSAYWVPQDLPERFDRDIQPPYRQRTEAEFDELVIIDATQGEPAKALLASEEIARYDAEEQRLNRGLDVDPDRKRPNRARRFIGEGRIWPLVDLCKPHPPFCPNCEGRDLKYGEYCPWCDRDAADHLIDPPHDIERVSPADLQPIRVRA